MSESDAWLSDLLRDEKSESEHDPETRVALERTGAEIATLLRQSVKFVEQQLDTWRVQLAPVFAAVRQGKLTGEPATIAIHLAQLFSASQITIRELYNYLRGRHHWSPSVVARLTRKQIFDHLAHDVRLVLDNYAALPIRLQLLQVTYHELCELCELVRLGFPSEEGHRQTRANWSRWGPILDRLLTTVSESMNRTALRNLLQERFGDDGRTGLLAAGDWLRMQRGLTLDQIDRLTVADLIRHLEGWEATELEASTSVQSAATSERGNTADSRHAEADRYGRANDAMLALANLRSAATKEYANTANSFWLAAGLQTGEGLKVNRCNQHDPAAGTIRDGVMWLPFGCVYPLDSVKHSDGGCYKLVSFSLGDGAELERFTEFARQAGAALVATPPTWVGAMTASDPVTTWAALLFFSRFTARYVSQREGGGLLITSPWAASLAAIQAWEDPAPASSPTIPIASSGAEEVVIAPGGSATIHSTACPVTIVPAWDAHLDEIRQRIDMALTSGGQAAPSGRIAKERQTDPEEESDKLGRETSHLTLDEKALALFFAEPSRNKTEIARLLKLKNVQSLSPKRCPKLHDAMKAWREANGSNPVRGTKDKQGNLEAWTEEGKDA
jgi:hypothetical protein